MEEEFVPYELALKLKELEFNEVCLTYYNFDGKIERSDDWAFGVDMEHKRDRNQCLAPLWQQAFRFFREKYKLLSFVDIDSSYRIYCDDIKFDLDIDSRIFKTHEDAELECIKKLIEIAKEQNIK